MRGLGAGYQLLVGVGVGEFGAQAFELGLFATVRPVANFRLLRDQELVERSVGAKRGEQGFLVDRIVVVETLAFLGDVFLELLVRLVYFGKERLVSFVQLINSFHQSPIGFVTLVEPLVSVCRLNLKLLIQRLLDGKPPDRSCQACSA